MMKSQAVFPAILQFTDDDELVYLLDDNQLLNELQNSYHAEPPQLIDHNGRQFTINTLPGKPLAFHFNTQISLADFNQLVRNHLVARQQCCVLKIEIESLQQGFELIRQTVDSE
jgi:hypothetical protein